MTRQELYKGSISWMARNPVAANLLMIMLLVGGFIMSQQINKEVFPSITMDQISINIAYPGASPEEVERGVLLAVEEAVRPVDGVKRVYSSASEGSCSVTVELKEGLDKSKALNDVQSAIDRITSFPEDIETPIISMPERQSDAITMVVYGNLDEKTLRQYAEQARDGLLGLPEVTSVEMKGVRNLEIDIEVSQEKLREFGLTVQGLANQIRATAIEIPAGGVRARSGEVLLRTTERRDYGVDFEDIPIIYGNNGAQVKLGQIANVIDGFEESDIEASYNGLPAISLNVSSVGDQNPTDVALAVKEYAKLLEQQLPKSIKIATWNDMTRLFQERMDLLLRNSAIGLALVLLILGLFLEPKLAFWVSLGIPVSFMGSFLFLPAMGVSLNMISMFAFLVTLGMVVDDAIVIGENIFHLRNKGLSRIEAAIQGAREMAMPVFFSIGTTIAAFFPLLFVPGIPGKIAFAIPIIVILVLILSLVESFFILPAHLAHVSKNGRKGGKSGIWNSVLKLQLKVSQGMENFIQKRYRPVVTWCVINRWIVLALSLTVFMVSIGTVAGGRIKYIDFPKDDKDSVDASATLPYGVSIEDTREVKIRLEKAAKLAIEHFGGESISQGIFSKLGQGAARSMRGSGGAAGSHITSVTVMLVSPDFRDFSSSQFAQVWRKEFGDTSILDSIVFSSTMHGTRKPIDFQVSHMDNEILQQSAKKIGKYLQTFEGVTDVDNGIELGKNQWNFKLKPEGANAGLTVQSLASQVRGAFSGADAFRQQRGRNEIKVKVRLTKQERESLETIENMMIRTPDGGEMPLFQAAYVDYGRAYTSIQRKDARRSLQIQAGVTDGVANATEVTNTLFSKYLPKLIAETPGLSYSLRGRQEDMKDFGTFMILGFSLALLAMFGLIAIPLRSYLQPAFVVMAAIPFGVAGSIIGHLVMGMDLSMFSIMGMMALAGVVVNDSIVLVTTANQFRESGHSPISAAIEASTRRFRPIFLTTATTFFGLAPMIMETSFSARMIIPMAVSLGFGIVVATTFVLLLVPSLFVMVENLRNWRKNEEENTPDLEPEKAGEVS